MMVMRIVRNVRPAYRDVAMGVLAFAALVILFSYVDFVERLFVFTRPYEHLELDDWIAAIPALALSMAWFSYRRLRESRRLGEELSNTVASLRTTTEELVRAKDAAEQANLAKSEFLATMSHEIRTPLNGVIPVTELLLETDLSDEQRAYARTVYESGSALLEIINDILDLSRLEAGRVEVECGPVNVGSILESVAMLFGAEAAAKDLELSLFVDPRVPKTLIGDGTKLRQVLLNLMGNAVKFTDAGGVTLSAALEDRTGGAATLRFEVADTGIGISEGQQIHVFDKFSQAEASLTRRYGGTGLGLAISKSLVELMGGEIGVQSTKGKGSRFWFTGRLAEIAAATGDTVRHPALESLRVLVVDGSGLNRQALSRQLSAWRVEAAAVGDGDAAVALLRDAAERDRPYHVAIVEHAPQRCDGLAVAAFIHHDPLLSTMRLVLTSVGGVAGTTVPNIDAILPKPVAPSALQAFLAGVGRTGSTEPPAADDQAQRESAPAGDALDILVAEDNKSNRELLVRILSKLGHRVEFAVNGREAVAAVEHQAFDVVLMDVRMPIMNGIQALQAIRSLEGPVADMPIIAVTADAMQGDREKHLALGFTESVSKPIDRKLLRRVLADCPRRTDIHAGFGDGEAIGGSRLTEAVGR